MKIQSVAILGAGAVGCYVLWGLADKAAANTLQLGIILKTSICQHVICPGKHLDRTCSKDFLFFVNADHLFMKIQ